VDNDANVAALGEHRFGAGKGYDSFMYISVSTGIGGGWILNAIEDRLQEVNSFSLLYCQ
jgi:predicted NBD/HSP70 family sugar kinase